MNQLVTMNDHQVVTSSLQVAEDFRKQHKHVLESIDELLGVVENPADLFHESTYTHEQNKQEYRMFFMNRDGFTLLAMGFTGKESLLFKLKYIEAFNQMERQHISQPKTQLEVLQATVGQMVEQEQRLVNAELRLETIEKEQENVNEILSLNPVEWRKKVTSILNRIATNQGGYSMYQVIRNESYQLLEDRARCNLTIRVNNRKKEMALQGVVKSKVNKVSKVDAIEGDTRLTEIYLAIVKELAIKYRVNINDIAI